MAMSIVRVAPEWIVDHVRVFSSDADPSWPPLASEIILWDPKTNARLATLTMPKSSTDGAQSIKSVALVAGEASVRRRRRTLVGGLELANASTRGCGIGHRIDARAPVDADVRRCLRRD